MVSKKKWSRNILGIALLFGLLILTSCSTGSVRSASANQVLSNKDGYQQSALYVLDDGKIFINKTYSFKFDPSQDADVIDKEKEEQLNEINDNLKEELPNQKDLTAEDIGTMQEIEISNGKVVVDKDKKEVVFSGDNFEKTFKFAGDSENRLVDSEKNEFEFSYEE
ncbi:hypothetical protein ACFC53_10110 [Enterococcus casseliflavus]|uniref:hypothetical protein n=1 Tax=Enterococcus casseliflavus TaxID=37734 RepID=UPI0035DF9CC5